MKRNVRVGSVIPDTLVYAGTIPVGGYPVDVYSLPGNEQKVIAKLMASPDGDVIDISPEIMVRVREAMVKFGADVDKICMKSGIKKNIVIEAINKLKNNL